MTQEIGILLGRLSLAPIGRPQAFPRDWQAEFARAAACGFQTIEWLVTGESLGSNPLLTVAGRDAIRALERQHSVRVSSVCADCFIRMPLVRVTEDERRSRLRVLGQLIEHSGTLGIETLLLPLLEGNALESQAEAIEFSCGMAPVIADAASRGIVIGIESDWSGVELRRLLDTSDSVAPGIYYDIGNATAVGRDVASDIRALGPHICGVHVKDRLRGGASTPLGQGDADFDAAFSALAEAGYDGPLILETPAGSNPVASAAANRAFVEARLAILQVRQ